MKINNEKVFVTNDDTQAFCSLCESNVPAVVEVVQEVYACEGCLARLLRASEIGSTFAKPTKGK